MSEINQIMQLHRTRNSAMDIFILTKPPNHERATLCWKLIAQSENAVVYLAGDGVYNLLCSAIKDLPKEKILACKEDVEARGVQVEERAIVLIYFYEQLVENIMDERNRIITF